MSIRYTILLPLLGLMLLAGILSGVTGWVGLGAVDDLSRLGSRTTEMNEASRIARDRFHRAEALIARVSAIPTSSTWRRSRRSSPPPGIS